jgi:hypothetical protein
MKVSDLESELTEVQVELEKHGLAWNTEITKKHEFSV